MPTAAPRYPGGYPDYLVNHERKPGIGPLAGWRGANGDAGGRRAAEPEAARALCRERAASGATTCRRTSSTTSTPTRAISRRRCSIGLIDKAEQIVLQLYCEPLQKFRLAARRATAPMQPPEQHRAARRDLLRSAADLVPAVRGEPVDAGRLPAARDHAAADADVPLVALAERLAAPDHAARTASTSTARRRAALGHRRRRLGVGRSSHHGRIKCQVRLMDGVNADTVWTWNAIGKRAGAWNLADRRARGDARLPAQPPDRRAAARAERLPLLELRPGHRPGGLVRPARAAREGAAAEAGESAPRFAADRAPAGPRRAAGDPALRRRPRAGDRIGRRDPTRPARA